jgi:hypothetical protein
MEESSTLRPYLRNALREADRQEAAYMETAAKAEAEAAERAQYEYESTLLVTQLCQRRADAINSVILAKEHVPGGSHIFSAHDAATAYDIALLLNGVAGGPVEPQHPAYDDRRVPSKPIDSRITRAITNPPIAGSLSHD